LIRYIGKLLLSLHPTVDEKILDREDIKKNTLIEDEVGKKTIQTEINLDIGSSQKYGLHNEQMYCKVKF